MVTGDGSGIELAFAERLAENGATMIICFGLDSGKAEPGNPQWVKGEIMKRFPNAEIIGYDWHYGVKDPFEGAVLAGEDAAIYILSRQHQSGKLH